MKKSLTLTEIEKAVVSLPQKRGRGVLIQGDLILTAAHCVWCTCSSRMALEDYNLVKVKIGNSLIKLNILFVDPVSDIAILGSPHELDLYDYYKRFEEFCNSVKAVRLSNDNYELFKPIPLKIFDKNKEWVEASGEITQETSSLILIQSPKSIGLGSSGGPIINKKGELVSINSNFNINGDAFWGSAPLPLFTLPRWILVQINDASLSK